LLVVYDVVNNCAYYLHNRSEAIRDLARSILPAATCHQCAIETSAF